MATPANDSYTVASGLGVYGGRYNWPSWRRAMAAQTWAEVGTNTLSDVDPEDNALYNPNHPSSSPWHGTGGQAMIITAWCGACFDQDGSVLWLPLSGGHGDYAGNEPYKIDLSMDAPEWVMLRNPSGAIGNTGTLNDGLETTGVYFDGRPRAVHSYNRPVYIPGVGPALAVQGNSAYISAAGTARPIIINPTTGEMSLLGAANPDGGGAAPGGSCYDPSRHSVWFKNASTGHFSRYDISTDTWYRVGSSFESGQAALTYLPDYDCIMLIDGGLTNDFAILDCATGTIYQPAKTGSLVGISSLTDGAAPVRVTPNQVAFWNNGTDTTVINTMSFTSNPRTDTWTIGQLPVSGSNAITPTVKAVWGTYGRFFYSERLKGFGVVNGVTQKLYFYASE